MKKAFIWLLSAALLCALALAVSAADAVAYVSDAGSDTAAGTSDAAPLKTLAAAYDPVGKGGTVVVCGPLTLSGNALHLPQSSGTVTITSVFGGTDYTKQGGAVLNLGGYTYLGGDTVFENIKINDSSSFYFNQLICGGHNLTIGNGVVCTKDSGEYITILGGMYINSNSMTAADVSFYDYTITVNSGLWYGVYGSNKRTSNESAMGATGNVSIIINGGSFTGKAANQADAMIAVGGFASQDGDYYLEINGGIFNCPIYGIARPGQSSGRYTAYYDGDVKIVINGGELRGATVSTVQSETASYIGGNYALEIAGANFTALSSIAAPRVRGTATCEVEIMRVAPTLEMEPITYCHSCGRSSRSSTRARACWSPPAPCGTCCTRRRSRARTGGSGACARGRRRASCTSGTPSPPSRGSTPTPASGASRGSPAPG